jgi:hypothetical protein
MHCLCHKYGAFILYIHTYQLLNIELLHLFCRPYDVHTANMYAEYLICKFRATFTLGGVRYEAMASLHCCSQRKRS